MSDTGSVGPLKFTATAAASGVASIPDARRPDPVAMLLLDTVTGVVLAANPAGHRKLAGSSGLQLSRWLCALATSSDDGSEVTTTLAWRGIDGTTAAPVSLWAQGTVIEYRARRCLLVVLGEDAPGGADPHRPTADPTCAVFTLDAVGRVDSWGAGAQRLTGFGAGHVLGSDTTLLHPGPARLAGEAHRALTDAYRRGEHRAEGWRTCSDGRAIWARVLTCALYDGRERLLGFAAVMHDLTACRRLTADQAGRVPGPRPAPAVRGPGRPGLSGRPGQSGRPGASRPSRVPGQRRPSNS